MGEAVMERATGFIRRKSQGLLEKNIPGVETFIHPHDGDAGFRITLANRGLDGGGAAMTGEQGGMDVQAAAGGDVQHAAGKQLAVGNDNEEIGVKGLEGIDFRTQPGRLEHGNASGLGAELDLGRRERLFAANRLVRLGDEHGKVMMRMLEQGVERRKTDVTGGKEGKAHFAEAWAGRMDFC